ncbi:MAG: glycoside hydrolase [Nitrosopumilus sp.]|uniref:sialidase family protein n=1 Tax=Nitrosopumilus sp. TaxID=2024843 RepID=UPI00247E97A9|nr:sialidase family protein [Nitrosopumilus sp.]MCV0391990.1 glycoside hydrolase [Nitrosopumilus sp.]
MKIVHFVLGFFALFIVAIMIGSVSNAYAITDFTPLQNISNNSHDSIAPFVVTDGKNIFITWSEFTSAHKSSDILISKSTDGGVTFSTPKNISNNSGASTTPFAIVDGANIFIAWTYRYQDDSHSEIYFSKSTDGGNTFSTPQKISNDSSFSSLPFLTIDGKNIFVTWFDITYSNNRSYKNMEVSFSKSIDGGDTFSEPKNISNNEGFSSFPSIASDGTNLFVAWQDNTSLSNTDILVSKSTDGGATFSTPLNISNSDDGSVGAHVATDGTNIFVTWFEFHNGSGDVFFAKSTDGGATFSTPQNISNNKENSVTPFMITNGTTIYITWTDSTSKDSWIVLSNSTDGGATFSTTQKISNDNGFSDGQSFTTDGTNLFVTWEYRQLLTSPLDVFFSKSNQNQIETHEESPENPLLDEFSQISDAEQIPDSYTEIPNYTIGTVEWVDSTPRLGGYGVVKITDPDMNINPDRVDIFTAKAWSKTDLTGINLDMIESGQNTGVFYIDIEFTSEKSGIQMLKTIPGDVVTVSYLDSTTPGGKEIELIDSMDITLDYVSPHKQLKLGISIDEMQCKENLVLIQRHDGSPACVTESTKQKLIERGWTGLTLTTKESLLKRYSNLPEVMAFYETYSDAEASVKNDHVSYFAGNEDDFRIRMDLEFNKNFKVENMELHCYVKRVHQNDVPQSFILKYLKDYTCDENGSQRTGNIQIRGDMADQICSVIDYECPSYFIGNMQEDGSIIALITSWDADTETEKQFVFIIKNDTLSYDVTTNEN